MFILPKKKFRAYHFCNAYADVNVHGDGRMQMPRFPNGLNFEQLYFKIS